MAGTPFKMKGSPMQRNYGIGSPMEKKPETDQEELTRLVNKRTKLKNKEAKRDAKREAGGKVLLGDLKTKINKKKLAKTQAEINANAKAQEYRRKGKEKQKNKESGPPTNVRTEYVTRRKTVLKKYPDEVQKKRILRK